MKQNYFKGVWRDLCYQPVIGAVSIAGTALAIFLIMVEVMIIGVQIDPLTPENNRSRMLYGRGLHIVGPDILWGESDNMSLDMAERLYGNLDGAQTAFTTGSFYFDMLVPGRENTYVVARFVDDAFMRMFDYEWVAGEPFSKELSDAGARVAVISEWLARSCFDSPEKAMGRKIYFDFGEYTVTGVIKDVSSLASTAYASVFVPHASMKHPEVFHNKYPEMFGYYEALITARSEADITHVLEQTRARREALASELLARGDTLVYHGAPFSQEAALSISRWGKDDSTIESDRKLRWFIYAVILLIPAINLSSMTGSRLRRRVSEIGVRRAFGARRRDIFGSVLTESMVMTAIGATIGLLLSVLFAYFFSGSLFLSSDSVAHDSANPIMPVSFLLNWRVFGVALVLCFVLNLLSAWAPARRAAKLNTVDALNNRTK